MTAAELCNWQTFATKLAKTISFRIFPGPGTNDIKYFTSVIYELAVFAVGRSFLISLMFESNAWSLSKDGAPERYFIQVGSGLGHKI
jgi:hypothetical protein